ncbi:hypothetical protein [Lactovum odontotermitis]
MKRKNLENRGSACKAGSDLSNSLASGVLNSVKQDVKHVRYEA